MAAFEDRVQPKNHGSEVRYVIGPEEFFRGADTPNYILEAYERLNLGVSSKEDEALICEFRELFCLDSKSPAKKDLVSIPCVIFDPQIYDVLRQDQLYREEVARDERIAKKAAHGQNAMQTKKTIRKAKKGVDVGNLKQTTQQPHFRRRQPAEETSIAQAAPKRVKSIESSTGGRQLRRMPSGRDLRRVQLSIQEDIIHQVAELELESSCKSSEDSPISSFFSRIRRGSMIKRKNSQRSRSSSDFSSSESSDDDVDRALEVHAEASRKLKSVLEDERLENMMSIENKNGLELEGDEKRAEIQDLLLISERMFEEIITEAKTVWSPSRAPITEEELADVVEGYLHQLDFLRDSYPSMPVSDIIIAFKKLAGRVTLEQIRSR